MGVLNYEHIAANTLQFINIAGHILLLGSLLVAVSSYWYFVAWPANYVPPTSVQPFSVGPFSCPDPGAWEIYMFRGFCNREDMDTEQNSDHINRDCIQWDENNKWKNWDRALTTGSSKVDNLADNHNSMFSGSREAWEAIATLIPVAIVLTIVSFVLSGFRKQNYVNLMIVSIINFCTFILTFTAWVLAATTVNFTEDNYDGLPGCGNAASVVGPGFIFAVIASMTALGLGIMDGIASSAADALLSAKTGRTGVDQPATTGYRPEIVA